VRHFSGVPERSLGAQSSGSLRVAYLVNHPLLLRRLEKQRMLSSLKFKFR